MEQIRVIKEMRQNDRDSGRSDINIRPRYMVWENVPGAFSSNGGEDFRAVLEETAHIADENAVIPQPPKGKWTTSGAIMGDGWSIAWRVLDAQFWGVPQRRRRIALVADFGGQSAPEILFERKGVPGDFTESRETGQRAAGGAQDGVNPTVARSLTARYDGSPCIDRGPNVVCVRMREGCDGGGKGPLIQAEKSGTLGTSNDQTICYGICSYASNSMKSNNPHSGIYEADTSRTLDLNGGNPACNQGGIMVYDARGNGDGATATVTYCCEDIPHMNPSIELSPCLSARGYKSQHYVNDIAAVDCRNGTENADINGTLQAKESGGMSLNLQNTVRTGSSVRRLTPLECERLQGYPDGWTDIGDWTDSKGKVHKPSDSARYKALGNSIALPPWRWVLLRITAQYERPATLGSLFDGIGGFPLIWERLNGDGTCLWASEIEQFCIAVTGMRFERSGENV
jgi:DNA (cytosine-5)-methyltransferase 1